MYGGKFLPLHKGHEHCIKVASEECDVVHVIMFHGGSWGVQEVGYLDPVQRYMRLCRVCERYGNVIPGAMRVSLRQDGTEDWHREAVSILALIGRVDAVYSSEPSYGGFFAKAYPGSQHRIVDADRSMFPVSGTMLRGMDAEEREKWLA
jgi:HTH-type transcriptional repressor of NAD biosynthesis genes